MQIPQLSVNINKIATLRNSRGGNQPSLLAAIDTVARTKAAGITIHPREDERHITRDDIFSVAGHLRKHYPHLELNIEGDPRPQLIEDILSVKPDQATLVPVTPGEITSDHGYDFDNCPPAARSAAEAFNKAGIRVAFFAETRPEQMAAAVRCGAHRIEIYTGPFSHAVDAYVHSGASGSVPAEVEKVRATISAAREAGLGVNAGHDLDITNLPYLNGAGAVDEVSIGHMITVRALTSGLEQSVNDFLAALTKTA